MSAEDRVPPAGHEDALAELARSLEIMDALRSPGGDAWSAQQTHASLARYLLEESHEVIEAIERRAPASELIDELGDLWFQILFHARLGEESDPAWGIADVARAFCEKMLRRNPHVFAADAEQALEDPADVDAIIAQWHRVKAAEAAQKGEGTGRTALTDGIPRRLPALQTAAKAVHRARSQGRLDALLAAADGETDGIEGGRHARALLDLVVAAEAEDIDPESALRTLLLRAAEPPEPGGPFDPQPDRDADPSDPGPSGAVGPAPAP